MARVQRDGNLVSMLCVLVLFEDGVMRAGLKYVDDVLKRKGELNAAL
jgi:hypothetical protein